MLPRDPMVNTYHISTPALIYMTNKLHWKIRKTNQRYIAVFPIFRKRGKLLPNFVTNSKIHRHIYPNMQGWPTFRSAPSQLVILSWNGVPLRAKVLAKIAAMTIDVLD